MKWKIMYGMPPDTNPQFLFVEAGIEQTNGRINADAVLVDHHIGRT
jgi:hypothetical protein